MVWVPLLLKTTAWQRRVPTTGLIVASRVLGPEATPMRVRRELDRRLELGQLPEWQQAWVLPALAADLRDDDITRNAERAARHLSHMGDAGRAELERALRSPDRQARAIAADALRDLHVPVRRVAPYEWVRTAIVGEPSDDLLRVTIELLDNRCSWRTGVECAGDPYAFLTLFPERVLPIVLEEWEYDDHTSNLHSAGVLVLMGLGPSHPDVMEFLIECLKDNSERRDAEFAARALYAAGPEAEPFLDAHLYAGDPQQRALVRLVLQNLRKFPESAGEFPDESGLWRDTFPGAQFVEAGARAR
jgi:hypothetical protein